MYCTVQATNGLVEKKTISLIISTKMVVSTNGLTTPAPARPDHLVSTRTVFSKPVVKIVYLAVVPPSNLQTGQQSSCWKTESFTPADLALSVPPFVFSRHFFVAEAFFT